MTKHTIDITKEHCPMTFVKVKLKLSKIAERDQLEVLLTEGEPKENVPRTAKDQGYRVLDISPAENGFFKVLIEK